jgi:hypothetical protein
MAGEQQRDHLVAKLLLGHRLAVVVARQHQHREQVTTIDVGVRLPFLDDRVDQAIDPAHAAQIADVAGQRDRVGNDEGIADSSRDLVSDGVERLPYIGNVPVHLGVEQRLGGDAQGHRHHLGVDVARFAGPPARKHEFGVADHHIAVARDPLRVKRRCRQPPLPVPELALAGQQALAEDRPHLPEEQRKLDEVAMVPDQDIFRVVGIVEQHDRPAGQVQRDSIAVVPRPFEVVAQQVATEFEQVAEQRQSLRTGRPACCALVHAGDD